MQPDSEKLGKIIERRAYESFLRRGREHGKDLDDWLAAEREILSAQDLSEEELRSNSPDAFEDQDEVEGISFAPDESGLRASQVRPRSLNLAVQMDNSAAKPGKESVEALGKELEPLCPRDNRAMRYEASSFHWVDESGNPAGAVPSYHCAYLGCTVLYNGEQGYFTVVGTPAQPYFVEEPGINRQRCPIHAAWLFRARDREDRIEWHCPVAGCSHTHREVLTRVRGSGQARESI